MNITAAINSFLFHCEFEKNLSPRTLVAYSVDMRQFRLFVSTERPALVLITDVDRVVLREYIKNLHPRLSEKSVKRKVASLKALFGYLEREDVVPVSPFHKMNVRIKEKRRLPRYLGLRDVRRLFQHLYARKRLVLAEGQSRALLEIVRDIALFELLFMSGARIGEICSLTFADVDVTSGRIRLLGKGGRERTIQCSEREGLAALREHAARSRHPNGEAYFFRTSQGNRLSEQTVRSRLRTYAQRAGLAGRVTPHMFRHSVATLLLEEGVDIRYIQQLLGHSSITTTQIYTRVNDRHQQRILARNHPRRRFQLTSE